MNARSKFPHVGTIEETADGARIVIPHAMLDALDWHIGDEIQIDENGVISRRNAGDGEDNFDKQMAVARKVMDRRRSALRELAK